MSMVPVLIGLTILGVVFAGVMFFWAVEHDQFDDMQTPALLPLDDLIPEPPSKPGAKPVNDSGHPPSDSVATGDGPTPP